MMGFLCLAINAENAVHRSEKFATMAIRTRQEYMKDLANNYVTSTSLESGSKLSKCTTLQYGIDILLRNTY